MEGIALFIRNWGLILALRHEADSECNRLFPNRKRLETHRRRDHNTGDSHSHVLSWNE